jgi:putative FmdB family regulatory protein
MPTYDYRCNACKHEFEHFQSMKDKPLKKCPECGKPSLERLIGIGAAVIFKGSGFYETDYRSEAYKKAADADKAPSEAAKTDAKPETKAESKPESKGQTKPDAKPDGKTDAKPAAKGGDRSVAKVGVKPSAKATSKPASKGSSKSKASK